MPKNSSIILSVIITVVVVAPAAFYGGMKYNQGRGTASLVNLQNMSSEQRQQAFQQMRGNDGSGGTAVRRTGSGQGGGGLVGGDIISKDDKSITVQLGVPGGANSQAAVSSGSKIVFLSDSTQVTKSTSGTLSDLAVGSRVMVGGDANSDGSVTAKTVQILPAGQQR